MIFLASDVMSLQLYRRLLKMEEALGRPLTVTSAWRSSADNNAVGGSPYSLHLIGHAVDLRTRDGVLARMIVAAKMAGFSPSEIVPESNHLHLELEGG
jgi:zinc D-Ala-D-Ala carboxypeptidase